MELSYVLPIILKMANWLQSNISTDSKYGQVTTVYTQNTILPIQTYKALPIGYALEL